MAGYGLDSCPSCMTYEEPREPFQFRGISGSKFSRGIRGIVFRFPDPQGMPNCHSPIPRIPEEWNSPGNWHPYNWRFYLSVTQEDKQSIKSFWVNDSGLHLRTHLFSKGYRLLARIGGFLQTKMKGNSPWQLCGWIFPQMK